jgi:hypothetical protein
MCCLNTTYDGRLPAGVDSAGEAISGQKFPPVGDPARALKELHSCHAILIEETIPLQSSVFLVERSLPADGHNLRNCFVHFFLRSQWHCFGK